MIRSTTRHRAARVPQRSTLLPLLVLAVSCTLGSPAAAQQPPAQAPAPPPAAAPPQAGSVPAASSLDDVMDGMKSRAKELGSALGRADRAAALGAVGRMQELILEAKAFPPTNMDAIPEAERPAHETAYRKDLLVMLCLLADLETQVLDGRMEEALAQFKGPVMQARDAAHEKYQPKHEPRGPRDGRGPGAGGKGGGAPKSPADPEAPTPRHN